MSFKKLFVITLALVTALFVFCFMAGCTADVDVTNEINGSQYEGDDSTDIDDPDTTVSSAGTTDDTPNTTTSFQMGQDVVINMDELDGDGEPASSNKNNSVATGSSDTTNTSSTVGNNGGTVSNTNNSVNNTPTTTSKPSGGNNDGWTGDYIIPQK